MSVRPLTTSWPQKHKWARMTPHGDQRWAIPSWIKAKFLIHRIMNKWIVADRFFKYLLYSKNLLIETLWAVFEDLYWLGRLFRLFNSSYSDFFIECLSCCSKGVFFVFFFFFFFFVGGWGWGLGPHSWRMAYEDSQTRGPIGATAASLHHSHSNTVCELPLWPTPQLTGMPDP